MRVRSLGRENPLEKGMTTHSSILDWKIPWTEEPGELYPIGLQRVRHDLACNHHHRSIILQTNILIEKEIRCVVKGEGIE